MGIKRDIKFLMFIIFIWVIGICFLLRLEVSAEEVYVETFSADADQPVLDNNNSVSENLDSEFNEIDNSLDMISQDTGKTLELVENSTKADSDSVTKEDLTVLNNNIISLHEDLQKLMISMWALCGFYMGSKLIRGLFGYG